MAFMNLTLDLPWPTLFYLDHHTGYRGIPIFSWFHNCQAEPLKSSQSTQLPKKGNTKTNL